MKARVSQWPALNVRVSPETWAQINQRAEERDLPASVIVREALGRAFGQDRAQAS
jgi:predicted transcriptional regulator